MARPSITDDQLRRAVDHVFLPPQLPQSSDEQSDGVLVQLTRKALGTLLKLLSAKQKTQQHDAIKHAMTAITNLERINSLEDGHVDAQALCKAIQSINHGDTLAMRISAQNAAVLISRQQDKITVEQFELSPLNEHPAPGMQPTTTRTGSAHVEIRDTTDCAMISEFFMSYLRAYGTPTKRSAVSKHTRDDVLWRDTETPWRRSPMWLLIRVTLQLVISRTTGGSRDMYKEIMTYIMAEMLRSMGHAASDVLYVMTMKIERRLKKMDGHMVLPEAVSTDIAAVLEQTSGIMSDRWMEVHADDRRDPDLPSLAHLDFDRDTWMSLPQLDGHVASLLHRTQEGNAAAFAPVSALIELEDRRLPGLPPKNSKDDAYIAANLCRYEDWIACKLPGWLRWRPTDIETCSKLHNSMMEYHALASSSDYRGNPESTSVMILTLYEIWVALDTAAVQRDASIADYDPEIPVAPLQSLLLPHIEQMERLHRVEEYINARSRAKLPAAAMFEMRSYASYACLYFDRSKLHQTLMDEIKDEAETKRLQKCAEFKEIKKEYEQLDMLFNALECSEITIVVNRDDPDNPVTEEVHNPRCEKCQIRRQRNALQITVYEHPLPGNEYEAKTVVFELVLPQWFGHWRDARLFLLNDVLHGKSNKVNFPHRTYTLSDDDPHLRARANRSGSHRTMLLSDSKPNYNTHYSSKSIANLQESGVCVGSGLRYQYFDIKRSCYVETPMYDNAISNDCTYKLGCRSLQGFVERVPSRPDGQAPNAVMATQRQCPSGMTLEEYRDLCTLPLGRHVQWTNLLLQLSMPSIDYKKLDTTLVILQLIYQTGPSGATTLRESHCCLLDEIFASKIVQALSDALDRVKANWESAQALRVLIAIATRVLSLARASTVRNACLLFLAEARKAALAWLDQVLETAHTTSDATRHLDSISRSVEIALICASTCDVGEKDLTHMLQDDGAASALIFSSIVIHNGKDYKFSGAGQQFRLLQARLKRTLARKYASLARNRAALDQAIRRSWAAYRPSTLGWRVNNATPDWASTTTASTTGRPLQVHYNCLTGALLVEGRPIAQPPKEISDNKMYKSLFGLIALEVMPSSVPGLQYSAKRPIAGHTVLLGKPASRSSDVTVQISNNNGTWETLPARIFRGFLPSHFVDDYIHWYSTETGAVEFRLISEPWVNNPAATWVLRKERRMGRWRLTRGACAVLPLDVPTSQQIAEILEPLAPVHTIHNVLDSAGKLHIGVPTLRLNFSLDAKSSLMESKEHPHTAVDGDQTTGVFIGMRNKLVLSPTRGAFRVLPIAEAAAVQYSFEGEHTAVSVSTSMTTKVHAVQIDDQLGRLIDNGDMDCKLYLAQLHALTAGCLPDPLTHTTGTEAALSLLDRADVKSFTQMSQAQVDRLAAIAGLSPSRQYYPRHKALMQTVVWDSELSFLVQHHRFRDAVASLLRLAEQAAFFFPESQPKIPSLDRANELLARRSTIRDAGFHISGYGAEEHTSMQDLPYKSRDNHAVTARMDNVTIITAISARDVARRHWAFSPDGYLWKELSTHGNICGLNATFDSRSLRYTTSLIESGLTTVLEKLPSAQKWLSDAAEYKKHKASIAMWMATMAFRGDDSLQLMQTLALGYLPSTSAPIKAPEAANFQPQEGRVFSRATLAQIVEDGRKAFDPSKSEAHLTKGLKESTEAYRNRRKVEWKAKGDAAIAELIKALVPQWPCTNVQTPDLRACRGDQYINVGSVIEKVAAKYKAWTDNQSLYAYARQIEAASEVKQKEVKLITFPALDAQTWPLIHGYTSAGDLFDRPAPSMPVIRRDMKLLASSNSNVPLGEANGDATNEELNDLLSRLSRGVGTSRYEQVYIERLQQSADSLAKHSTSHRVLTIPNIAELSAHLVLCDEDVQAAYETLRNAVTHPGSSYAAQQWPRICPIFFLRQLARDRWPSLSKQWQRCIVSYGVALTAFQQACRMLKFAQQSRAADLMGELLNPGHASWKVSQHPETLLMEIESGILVREVQHSIAEHMRAPKSGTNSVMQLNMGEGKSTVITPMVAASQADGEQLSRVFVAKPQSKQMAQMLIAKLGGLLNRRVYYMPFSRSLQISLDAAQALNNMLRQCTKEGGVLLLQPEHILSFRLMALQCCIDGKDKIGQSIMGTLNFLDEHCRDLVDEADENFSVRFELIYTVGTQCKIDLDRERWLLIHEILDMTASVAWDVAGVLPQSIEISQGTSGGFPRIRILRPDAERLFQVKLAERVRYKGVAGLCVSRQSVKIQKAVEVYISKCELTDAEINAVEKSAFWNEATKPRLLLLRGLIARGLMTFCLGAKRWRVHYGLATRVPATRLAVPYRAKDSPTPRSEFSHPDVIIILTSLCYYYQGLEDDDMFDALSHLLASDQANIEY
ncbi:hypothetical protein LTR95_005222 [Oleoguttula sp. CCFEE 5521]